MRRRELERRHAESTGQDAEATRDSSLDDIEREIMLSQIQDAILKSIKELRAIEREIPMLLLMEQQRGAPNADQPGDRLSPGQSSHPSASFAAESSVRRPSYRLYCNCMSQGPKSQMWIHSFTSPAAVGQPVPDHLRQHLHPVKVPSAASSEVKSLPAQLERLALGATGMQACHRVA